MLIFILGYMGSGKTTFGRLLAGRMNLPFFDLDEVFEQSAGYRINDYFAKFGEDSFRKKEKEILYSVMDKRDAVIAAGGGTPCFFENMAAMNRKGITVFLDPEIEVLLERIQSSISERPLLKNIDPDKLPEFIREHLKSRRIYYEKATYRIAGYPSDLKKLIKILRNFTGNKPIQFNE